MSRHPFTDGRHPKSVGEWVCMRKSGQLAALKRRSFPWRSWLVCLAILCVDAHLASRFHLPLSGAAVVQSNSAKVQHMDQDGYRWLPPALSLSFLFVPILVSPPAAAESDYTPPRIDCLYNRPPPAVL
jgi:hypothetical protein